ncbi:LysR family transcriptional regulator [Methylobacterium sp. Leaf104]|uniref:LysR family transcriptional regulator n=1 Tax=Methylobacterium TaxID=407 RepID=UPI0006FD2B3A|nr:MULTISPECIES: LysR family transcriptional regulator [Methylobacterium]KQP38188.1 LysR family transcriptional regulator [Methylobacterium sp. Leaf104]MCI9880435.1 LysR family transcriptional regulator [Methylobacterium goesingense]
MELKWIEDFISLAETRSFSRSAEARFVTQSAFSRRIRSLEVWLGTVLLDRSTYPITLTADGRQFLETAEEVLRLLTLSRTDFRNRSERSSLPVVTIAALHSLCLSVLPRWLNGIREAVGPMASRVLPDNFNICVQALVEGGYDLLLTYHHPGIPMPLDPERYPHRVIGRDSLVAVAAPDGLPPDRDGRLPLLQYSRGSFLGLLAAIAQSREGAPVTYPIHTNENSMAEALRSMALAGHGVAWLPVSLVAGEIAAGALEVVSSEMLMEIRLYRSAERARPFLDAVWAAAALDEPNYALQE